MGIENLKKKSHEELIEIIEKLNQQYEISIDDENNEFRSVDFRTIVEAAYDIIFVINKDMRIQYTNQAWRDTLASRDATPGRLYTDYLHEIELERGNFVVESGSLGAQFRGRRQNHLFGGLRASFLFEISHLLVRKYFAREIYVEHRFWAKQILCGFACREYKTRSAPKSQARGISQFCADRIFE